MHASMVMEFEMIDGDLMNYFIGRFLFPKKDRQLENFNIKNCALVNTLMGCGAKISKFDDSVNGDSTNTL